MGTRVHKDIGYFLSKKNISKVLVKKYDDIIDKNYIIKPETIQKIIDEITVISTENPQFDRIFPQYQLKELIEKGKTDIHQFFKDISDYDTFKGVLFLTPQLAKYSRGDDLIDYYEEVKNLKFNLNLLKSTIYPDSFYFCLKVPPLNKDSLEIYAEENKRKPILEIGDLVMADRIRYLMLYNSVKNKDEYVNIWAYPEKEEEKYFHPYINIMTYAFAKVLGILKPNVSYLDFAQLLEPAIITHWG